MPILVFQVDASVTPVVVADTANLHVIEGPFQSQRIYVFDSAYLSLTESAPKQISVSRAEFARLHLIETASLGITVPVPFNRTDTASLHLAESSSVSVAVNRTDTARLTLSEVSTRAVTSQELSRSDSASLSLAESSALQIFTDTVPLFTADMALLSVSENADTKKSDAPNAPTSFTLSTSGSRFVLSTS